MLRNYRNIIKLICVLTVTAHLAVIGAGDVHASAAANTGNTTTSSSNSSTGYPSNSSNTTGNAGQQAGQVATTLGGGNSNGDISLTDALSNAFNNITSGQVTSAVLSTLISGTASLPLDFGNGLTGGVVYNTNTGNWGLTVPGGSSGQQVSVSSINDITALGINLGGISVGASSNGSGGISIDTSTWPPGLTAILGPFINSSGVLNIGWGSFGVFFGVGGMCGQSIGGGVGQVICNVTDAMGGFPAVMSIFAYISAMILMVFGTLKLVEHVNDPRNVPIWEPIKRYTASGALFSLPFVMEILVNAVGFGIVDLNNTGMATGVSGGGLDALLVRLMADIWTPMIRALEYFAYLAGFVFMLIGIHRLLKSSQDGPRGPAGIGTIMTFIVAGALFSVDTMLSAFSGSMFNAVAGGNNVYTYGALAQTTGDTAVDDHIAATIGVATAFMFIVGWISFIRGFFILRAVAEGDQQASFMAAVTHLLGGALAVNIGPVIMAVQSTLGLTGFGLLFK